MIGRLILPVSKADFEQYDQSVQPIKWHCLPRYGFSKTVRQVEPSAMKPEDRLQAKATFGPRRLTFKGHFAGIEITEIAAEHLL